MSERQDLVEFFKTFLFTFQYPGAHVKSHENKFYIENGVAFKPAQKILQLLKYAEEKEGKRAYLTKAEICHCLFNDLRCVRDKEAPSEIWNRIISNRINEIEYDTSGDVIRYAGDIVDYMEIANLLVSYNGKNYYYKKTEEETILKFIESKEWFKGYDSLYGQPEVSIDDINAEVINWFEYVNRKLDSTDFSTDIISLLTDDVDDALSLKSSIQIFIDSIFESKDIKTKDIGDMGESLVHGHESQRVKNGGRDDLIHLIKRIPTPLAMGFDIQSVELDEKKRYIEVKTTISSKPLHFNKVHLTPNEWSAAESLKDRYYIYRLMISKKESKLFLMQNPVGLYKQNRIAMIPRDGVDIVFNTKESGVFEELLIWGN